MRNNKKALSGKKIKPKAAGIAPAAFDLKNF